MTVINIGQMLTNNFNDQRQSDGYHFYKQKQKTLNRPMTSHIGEKNKIHLKNNLNNTFFVNQNELKNYYDTHTSENVNKQKKNIDIIASSMRPQFEIDRFKNVKKTYSSNSMNK